MATATARRKYESGSQRYSKLAPLTANERVAYRREALGAAMDQLRASLEVDPSSVRTYAYAACTRFAEYESAIRLHDGA